MISLCLWAFFHPLSHLLVVFTKYKHFIKSQYDMLQFNMKCWNSTFNAQDSRLIVVLYSYEQWKMKIYVATMEVLKEKKKIGRNSIYHQNRWFFEFHPVLNANVFFYKLKKNSPSIRPNLGFWCFSFLTLWIILMTIKCRTLHFISNCRKFVIMSHIL